jgi:hypothetical protein
MNACSYWQDRILAAQIRLAQIDHAPGECTTQHHWRVFFDGNGTRQSEFEARAAVTRISFYTRTVGRPWA